VHGTPQLPKGFGLDFGTGNLRKSDFVSAPIQFLSLRSGGSVIVPYTKAWDYQKALLERRVRGEVPDTFLFVEHPPTITRGRGLQRKPGDDSDLRAMPMTSASPDTEYFEIERGGDLTWHGPGQLVVYPVVKLDGQGFGPNHDVTGFLRKLESVFGGWLAGHGLITEARENATGIWVTMPGRPARKIASIGIAVRKWVTYHGIGVNLANSLDGFRLISPCGFDPEVMTTLASESPDFRKMTWSEVVRSELEIELAIAIRPDASVSTQEV
jgi:lipoate-protein ligase B